VWVCFYVFKNHVPQLLRGDTKHHFLNTFIQKLVRYIMIYISYDPFFLVVYGISFHWRCGVTLFSMLYVRV